MRITVNAFLLLLALTVTLGAATQTAPGTPTIDPQAQKVLRRAIDYYAKLECMRVTVSQVGIVQIGSKKQTIRVLTNVQLKRPNKAFVMIRRNKQTVLVRCDGEKFYLYFPKKKEYIERDAPANLADIAKMKDLSVLGPGGLGLVLFGLLGSDAYNEALRGVTALKYAGLEKIDGVACHHLIFSQRGMDLDAWFADGEDALLYRVSLDMSRMLKELAKKRPNLAGAKMTRVAHYRQWSTGSLPDSRFTFKPPASAKKVDAFTRTRPGGRAGVGAVAPDFSLKLLDGGSMKLSQHKGKDIVMLDFWATWCGPCRRALPIVAEIAKEYEGKGVVVYAVNQRESPAAIRRFLKDAKVEINVALDSDGAVGDRYGVEGIPTTVIIDKTGTVRRVHSGYSPSMKAGLKRDLDALLEGRD